MEDTRGTVQYQQHKTIGEFDYVIHVMTPTISIKLLTKIMKLLGEPFAEMAGAARSAKGKDEAKQKAAAMLPAAVKALCNRMDEDEVVALIKQLMKTAHINNQPVQFERHFQGRLGHLMKVIWIVLEVQYEDFLTALTDLMSSTDLSTGAE